MLSAQKFQISLAFRNLCKYDWDTAGLDAGRWDYRRAKFLSLQEPFEKVRDVVPLFVQNYSQYIDTRRFEVFADFSGYVNFRAFRFHHQYDSVHFPGQKRGLRIVPQRGTI